MKKLFATIGVAATLGVGAFALNSVMPASAGPLGQLAAEQSTSCGTRTTLKDVLDKLVTDGTITADQETKIVDALKAAHQANAANHPKDAGGPRMRAIEGAAKVAAAKIGVTIDDLKTAVQSGKSVADVANEHSVAPSDVEQAIVDAGTKRIDDALANGRVTDQQAGFLKARLPEMANKFVNRKGGDQPCPPAGGSVDSSSDSTSS